MSRIILALTLACSASAFMVPGKVFKVPRKLATATVRPSMVATSTTTSPTRNQPVQAYPAIKLPYDAGAKEDNVMPEVRGLVGQFRAAAGILTLTLTSHLSPSPSPSPSPSHPNQRLLPQRCTGASSASSSLTSPAWTNPSPSPSPSPNPNHNPDPNPNPHPNPNPNQV